MTTSTTVDWLTIDDIVPAVQELVDKPVTVSGDWSSEPFVGGAGDALGIWRVAGTASTGDAEITWSLVLKGYPSQEGNASPSAWDSPRREAELYRSGLLESVPGVSAPSCYGTVERNNEIWLWLEDLSPYSQQEWTLERFETLARAMGTMNGAWLARRPLPDLRCLSRRWLEGWMAANDDAVSEFAVRRDPFWDLVPDIASLYLRLWDNRHRHLEFLSSMPQTFCHLDAHAKNAFARPRDGQEEFVLVDWSFAGLAAPGEELAALVASSIIFVPDAFPMRDVIETRSFPAYLKGLREAGWDGSDEDIWRAYRSSLVLRYGPGQMRFAWPDEPSEEFRLALEATFGMPLDAFEKQMIMFSMWIAERITDAP